MGVGFGSEILNLVYAIYFFKQKNYDFKIISFNWTHSYKYGWLDYFDSLKSEHLSYSPNFKLIKLFIGFLTFLPHNIGYLTFQIISIFSILNRNYITRLSPIFRIIRESCHKEMATDHSVFCMHISKVLNSIWVLKPEIQKRIQEDTKTLLPYGSKYVAIHIRRGDKVGTEDRKHETSEYLDVLQKLNVNIKTVFLMSDDYSTYIEIKELLKDKGYKIVTFLKKADSRGYNHKKFRSLTKEEIRAQTLGMITEVEIAKKSALFIGTRSSNIFRLIEYFRLNKCIDISQTELLQYEL